MELKNWPTFSYAIDEAIYQLEVEAAQWGYQNDAEQTELIAFLHAYKAEIDRQGDRAFRIWKVQKDAGSTSNPPQPQWNPVSFFTRYLKRLEQRSHTKEETI